MCLATHIALEILTSLEGKFDDVGERRAAGRVSLHGCGVSAQGKAPASRVESLLITRGQMGRDECKRVLGAGSLCEFSSDCLFFQ